jgi:superfamily II RNA helicase
LGESWYVAEVTDPTTDSANRPLAPLERHIPQQARSLDGDQLLDRFLEYTNEAGIELYPAQEEAILEIFAGNHVVLNTPTGSGKSMVALAVGFKALCDGGFAFYTAPIKALVTEKFFELCGKLGSRNVGMMTGDASVNRDAPVICCTAEILANLALREGDSAQADWVVMDEFHYYSDRDRGAAWQLPLLTLPQSRFLLMSATMGNPEFFVEELNKRTRFSASLVQSFERPVPLDFTYSETPLQEQVLTLAESGKVPVYIVHFSQRAASEQAQKLTSLDFLDKTEKQALRAALVGFRFDSPFGKELARTLPHGIGVHHAGMLPKYRRLVEQLAQRGLLRIICGTDTLGVGVNVPIRTVLFTQLCKFDGENTILLTTRDFQQIAGRAGRKGFDVQGSVIVQAPEHEIENKQLRGRAGDNPKKLRKLRARKPPDRGYKPWNAATLEQLKEATAEPLVSSVQVSHGLLLNALLGQGGCRSVLALLGRSHESEVSKRRLRHEGFLLFQALLNAQIIETGPSGVRVHADLQEDFSMNHALTLYAVEAFDALDHDAPDYALALLSVVEAIMESPSAILYRQLSTLKGRKVAELKAEGVDYDERMEELEKVEINKPESEFIYETFNLFAKHHPWVAGHNIAPKSIARDMHELAASFNDYIKEYGLARAEGVLLRYLTDVYRTLRQMVPEKHKTEHVWEIEEWLGGELRSVDASLIEEWERLQSGDAGAAPQDGRDTESTSAPDITKNRRAFSAMVRNGGWRVVQALSRKTYDRAVELLRDLAVDEAALPKDAAGEVWSGPRLRETLQPYWDEYEVMLLDADARCAARAALDATSGEGWVFRQTLSDPEADLEWALEFRVDLDASRKLSRPILTLLVISSS